MVQRGIAQGSGAFVAVEEMFGPIGRSARSDCCRRISTGRFALTQDRPGLDDILPTMLMPCCLYAGR